MSASKDWGRRLWPVLGALTIIAVAYWLGYQGGTRSSEQVLRDGARSQTLPQVAPLRDVIQQATSCAVLAYNAATPAHQQLVQELSPLLDHALCELNTEDSPTRQMQRINECSRLLEDTLQALLQAHPAFDCGFPLLPDGRSQRAGYPDLIAQHLPTGVRFYLDPKLYEQHSADSTLRTFYYSPRSARQKVQHDALHLLLGVAHDGKTHEWSFLSWTLSDLSAIPLCLKSEYNASNRELYAPQHQITASGNLQR